MARFARRPVVIAAAVAAAVTLAAGCSDGARPSGEAGWRRIGTQELQETLADEGVVLINVHVPFEGDIPGTDASIPYTELASRVDELPGDPARLVIYCRSGNMSTAAAQDLVDAGYTGFAELEGGFTAWQAAGLPFET